MTNKAKVKSAQRTLRLLELLANNRRGLSFTEIQEHLEIPKSSTHSLIQELIDNNYLIFNNQRKIYYAGLDLIKLSTSCIQNTNLIDELSLLTDNIGAELGHTTHSGILDDHHIMYLTKHETNTGLSLMNSIGVKIPAHCTALGKILLSQLSDEVLHDMYKDYPFGKITRLSIDNYQDLLEEIEKIRKNGYSEEIGEASIYTACIALPIQVNNNVVAAASTTLPIDLYNDIDKQGILKIMKKHLSVTEQRL